MSDGRTKHRIDLMHKGILPFEMLPDVIRSGSTPGEDGEDGLDGPPGRDGAAGSTGATGATGATGLTGLTGESGQDGEDGIDGVPGATGATGPVGIPGIGIPGEQGDDGYDGIPGLTGSTGITGATGETGLQGIPGVSGADGEDGGRGIPGPQGDKGLQGDRGVPGDEGQGEDAYSIPGVQLTTATPTTQAMGDSASRGVGSGAALEDHKHAMPTAKAVVQASTVQGAAFPGSPATNDRFYRTDLAMEFYYDGTRWLTTQLFELYLGVVGTDISATLANAGWAPANLHGGSDLWLLNAVSSVYVNSGGTALGASHKWVVTFQKGEDSTININNIASSSYDSGTNGVRSITTAINALLRNGTTNVSFQISATKTGTPGAINLGGKITYRVVAT